MSRKSSLLHDVLAEAAFATAASALALTLVARCEGGRASESSVVGRRGAWDVRSSGTVTATGIGARQTAGPCMAAS